jgi:choline trimethylamine-lyase
MSTDTQVEVPQRQARVKRLRDQVRIRPHMCVERAYYMTESYRQTEGQPAVLRRAKALANLLQKMTVRIEEGDLLVGAATSKRVAAPMLPEVQWQWYQEELETLSLREFEKFQPLTEEEKAKARDIFDYWKGKSVYDKWIAVVPEDHQKLNFRTWAAAGASPHVGIHLAHCCPGYERLMNEGVSGIKGQVAKKRAKLDLADADDFNASIFYQAVDITLDGLVAYAGRYARLARDMAAAEADPVRKAELECMAANCDRVPAETPTTFWGALQSVWFTYLALMLEGWGPGIAFGRMDQYLYPFYKSDLEAGRITKEDALELIALFYVKVNELVMPFKAGTQEGSGQIPLSVITIGGIDRNGNDAINELSYLFLEAEQWVQLQEDLAVRIHVSEPDSFVVKACETAKLVRGKIKFVSDETIVQQLAKDGKPIRDAREYGIAGCFIRTVPGRSSDTGADFLNLPLMLELALNNGVSRVGGDQIGPQTGDPAEFASFDDVWGAYAKQVEYTVRNDIIQLNPMRQIFAETVPTPFQSAFYAASIEKGLDVTAGGTNPYSTMGFWVCGIPNVGDSLHVINKLCFEDKKVSLARLCEALDRDFEGEDEILHLISKVPKYGNDDDAADMMVNQVLLQLDGELAKYRGWGGCTFTVAAGAIVSNIPFGKAVGALPDGRRAGLPLSEGGISPYQGRNVSGPTSTMRSVAKLDLARASGGAVLNMRFNPDGLKDDAKMKRFAQMLKTFCATGGDLIQFNIVSSATLRDAQKHPENYRDLLVRVATYSAYFVEIPVEMQNDIIARTEFEEL